jgi:hypothetical protein
MPAGGTISLTATGAPGINCLLQMKTNPAATSWATIATNTQNTGVFNFTDPNTGAQPQRFYRTLYWP